MLFFFFFFHEVVYSVSDSKQFSCQACHISERGVRTGKEGFFCAENKIWHCKQNPNPKVKKTFKVEEHVEKYPSSG